MDQRQYNELTVNMLEQINNKLGVLIGLLKPLKNISEDIEVSKVSLNKMLKQDKSTSVHVPQVPVPQGPIR